METSAAAIDFKQQKNINFRYDTSGQWYKGSLHLHTVRSDGHLGFEELVEKYSQEKFDFISVTDHWCVPEFNGNQKPLPLLVMPGIELDGYDSLGSYYHVLAIGATLEISIVLDNFIESMQAAYNQGALLIWAHPHWTGNTSRDGLRHNFHGLEIYNHSSHCENGSGYALSHWDRLLNHNPNFLGFATDDSHFVPGYHCWNGGWVMVNAPVCTQAEILSNIREGNFYATQGPEFKSIEYSGTSVTLETSPVAYIRLIGPRRVGNWIHSIGTKQSLTQAKFELPTDWPYARIEIEDASGKLAWSNSLWTLGYD